MKFLSVLIITLFFTIPSVASPDQFYSIERQTSEYLLIRLEFPSPGIHRGQQNLPAATFTIDGLPQNYIEGEPLLPVWSAPVLVPPGKVRWEMVSSEQEFLSGLQPVPYSPGAGNGDSVPLETPPAHYPEQIVQLRDAGLFRDYRLMNLQVYPLQATPSGIRYYKSLKIRIRYSNFSGTGTGGQPVGNSLPAAEKGLFRHIAINGSAVGRIAPANVFTQNPPATPNQTLFDHRVKLFVDKKGIYRVTGQDLLDADIDIQSIDPQTLRLTNKGVDVHLLVSGDQDQSFDPEDFVEFWGERNEKAYLSEYPDVYTDPFSDENVYWLSWGGSPGVRMVEESGAIIQPDPTKYNTTPYYPFTVHLEKDRQYERLGYANTRNLSYTQDVWFFDTGIQAIGKKSYFVDLIYPDSSSFTPVTVTTKMTGKSQGGHQTMIWLNQSFVGQTAGEWFSQEAFTLTNAGSSSIWPANLRHGANDLQIQMPALASGGKSDFILFNWADITYDRQYKADHNFINFSRPNQAVINFPQISLYQFEVFNFTRPDIEVYKKEVSKIVNFSLDTQTSGTGQRFKIIFQDEVLSDDVEYMALTSNQKFKPLRIEADKSFDPQQPQLSLKDPSNSADYLIITHDRFYKRALPLADYRRQQGLNVVMVPVQDIYDEFNYGIKSPLAIQDFLRYVFYNWDRTHRLKYVLLLGDANFDYKNTTPGKEDFVPTLFYQSLQFGAVATDLPFSLISGDDKIPDIFIGRIPVASNADVILMTEKIMEYEQNPASGDWKNQTLFLSGNDRSTYEFSDRVYQLFKLPKKPAFRTQNQRVIDMLLPKEYSSFRLNTVKDTSLQFDPNFGGTTDLIDHLDNGVGFMTFLGHGGGAIWADVQLLNLQDVQRLNNKGMYPFVASMTCFTGAFDNPGNPGLAQSLLLNADKGAIAVFASSGLGWVANDYSVLWNLMQELFKPGMTFGEAVGLAKIDYFTTGQYVTQDTLVPGQRWGHNQIKWDMIHQYNLLGDPAMTLSRPEQSLSVEVDKLLPLPGDTLNVQILSPLGAGDGYLELADGNNNMVLRDPLFMSGGFESRQIVVPGDFPQGIGTIRAYVSNSTSDAVGYKQIGVNVTLFDSVRTIPENPNAEDSVAIRLVALNNSDIASVRVVAFIPRESGFTDTLIYKLPTTEIEPDVYQTTGKVPPTLLPRTVYLTVYATTTQGQETRANYQYHVREDRPDPRLYSGKIRFVGIDRVQVGVTVGNNGDVAAQNIELRVYSGKQNFLADQPFITTPVSVDGKDSLTVAVDFPFPLNVQNYQLYAQLDRQEQKPDFNRQNNTDSTLLTVDHYNISNTLGSTYTGATNDTLNLTNNLHHLWVAPQTIAPSSAVLFRLASFPNPINQARLRLVPLADHPDKNTVLVKILNPESQFSAPFSFRLKYDRQFVDTSGVDVNKLRLYRWNQRLGAWLQVDALHDTLTGTFDALLSDDGYFAPFESSDQDAPRIELTVEGRHIRSKAVVNANPVLNVVLEDESGLNITDGQIQVLVDNQPLPENRIFLPDSVKQSKILGISLYPELVNGESDLSVQVKDVNGNTSRRDYTLRVEEDFDMHVYGNYPNPFTDFTIFTYYLTRELDELEIRIFTVSGRLIKRIENDINTTTPGNDPKRIGYGELIWDGTDEDGNEVANGLYYAVVRGKFENEEKKEILKVAKLR